MIDFTFHLPTQLILGKGSSSQVGKEISERGGSRVLIVNDGGAYLEPVLKTVRESLESKNLEAFEMAEKATQPRLSLIRKGIEFCKENKIDFLLAVGGGTVMDTAKGIAFLAVNDGHLTDWVLYRKASDKCMKIGSIVTLSGTGSEVSGTAMIMDDSCETVIKYPLFQESMKFLFSIMDPSLTCSLPMRTTMAGSFDAITHIMEHYFNGPSGYDLQDRLCESVMASILHNMKLVKESPTDYEVRAQLQMGATIANSTFLGLGCDSDWAVHYMENPITTQTHQLHGATLAIIAPAWMRYCFKRDLTKAVHFATRVMEVPNQGTEEEIALKGIEAFELFLKDVGLPTKLSEIGIEQKDLKEMAHRAMLTSGKDCLGGISHLTEPEVTEIYNLAL